MCAEPVHRGDAPTVARHEPGEAELRHRCAEVVADAALVVEELGGHDGADGVAAEVFRSGVATAVAVEAGERVGAAGLEVAAQHIAFGHGTSMRDSPRRRRPLRCRRMTIAELLADAFGRVQEEVHAAVDGCTPEELAYRIDDDANSIAWLAWHLTRIQD